MANFFATIILVACVASSALAVETTTDSGNPQRVNQNQNPNPNPNQDRQPQTLPFQGQQTLPFQGQQSNNRFPMNPQGFQPYFQGQNPWGSQPANGFQMPSFQMQNPFAQQQQQQQRPSLLNNLSPQLRQTVTGLLQTVTSEVDNLLNTILGGGGSRPNSNWNERPLNGRLLPLSPNAS